MSAPVVSRRDSALANVRAIVFDLGGTVIEIRHDAIADIARRHGGDVPAGWIAVGERAGRERLYQLSQAKGASEDTWVAQLTALLVAAGVPAAAREAAFADLVAFHRAHHLWGREMPAMGDTLATLAGRGYRIAAVSNSDGRAVALLASLGLLARFEFVVDSQDVGVEKPDPRIFTPALDQLSLPAHACAYVGDLTPVDVVGARAAGLLPVLFDPYDVYAGDAPFATAHGDAPRARGPADLLALFPGRAEGQ